jgi:AAA+ superfamily predicted ATPase
MNPAETKAGASPNFATLLPAMQRLDRLLDWAVKAMQASRGPELAAPFRGLYVSRAEVSRLLTLQPGAPQFPRARKASDEKSEPSDAGESPLEWMVSSFGLSDFDADLILLALAPELDLRYEKIYSFLQDDVTRKRPTVELALNLFCANAQAKLERRGNLSPESPLRRHRLMHLVPDPNQVEPSFLAYYLKLDDQVTRLLLGESRLDPRLANECSLIEPSQEWNHLTASPEIKQVLPTLAANAGASRQPLAFYFYGPRGSAKRETAEALAHAMGMKLLTVRCDRLPEKSTSDNFWQIVFREAQFNRAYLFVSELDDFRGQEAATRRQDLLDAVARFSGITILSGCHLWVPSESVSFGVVPVQFEIPNLDERRTCWESRLQRHQIQLDPHSVETLAARFRLTSVRIEEAVTTAVLHARWRAAQIADSDSAHAADSSLPTLSDLAAAARSQCGHELANLSNKINPRYSFQDIVLPDDQFQQLRETCRQAEFRHVVYGSWGFDRKLSLGKGLNVLFSGPPGTGKTMAAEVLAHELQLDLYRIDLSQVVNKYIGETEKNLDRIFTAAENSNAILFFDEADALFGKRSEVRDSHDRYANIEISYLLQKMEEYQGISILATNLRQNLDDAFTRRLQAVVEFPFPDEEFRRRIWESIFPIEAPLDDSVRFDLLARNIHLAGGNIKNIALAAAFFAAAEGGVITMSHLIQAARREHQKLGRAWKEIEIATAKATAA